MCIRKKAPTETEKAVVRFTDEINSGIHDGHFTWDLYITDWDEMWSFEYYRFYKPGHPLSQNIRIEKHGFFHYEYQVDGAFDGDNVRRKFSKALWKAVEKSVTRRKSRDSNVKRSELHNFVAKNTSGYLKDSENT
jgi:hypothetical protein